MPPPSKYMYVQNPKRRGPKKKGKKKKKITPKLNKFYVSYLRARKLRPRREVDDSKTNVEEPNCLLKNIQCNIDGEPVISQVHL